jgi:hypothetical protein
MRCATGLCGVSIAAVARAGSVANRFGRDRLWLGRGKRLHKRHWSISGGHEVSLTGRHGLADLSTSMMTMWPR